MKKLALIFGLLLGVKHLTAQQSTFYNGLYSDYGSVLPGSCTIPAFFNLTGPGTFYECGADNHFHLVSASAILSGTSASNLSISTGSKTFSTQASISFAPGMYLRATSLGTGDYMEGTVTNYVGTTLIMNMTLASGSGSHTDWSITLAGIPGGGSATNGTNGQILTSNGGGAYGTALSVGANANNIPQINGSGQLPAVSAALLTNFPPLNQDTTGTSSNVTGIVTPSHGGSGVANSATHTLGSANQNWSTLGTGIVKNTTGTGALSNAGSADIISLFTGCSGSQYLGADGACHNNGGSGGGGNVNTSGSPTNHQIPIWVNGTDIKGISCGVNTVLNGTSVDPVCLPAIAVGTPGSVTGSITVANGAGGGAGTTFGSAATTGNNFNGPVVVVPNGHIVDMSTSGTVGTVHDSGLETAKLGITNPVDSLVVNYIGTDGTQHRIAQSGGSGGGVSVCTGTSGSGSTYLVTCNPTISSYGSGGLTLLWIPDVNVTAGAVNINASSLGNKRIFQGDGTTNPFASTFVAGNRYPIYFDGTSFTYPNGYDSTKNGAIWFPGSTSGTGPAFMAADSQGADISYVWPATNTSADDLWVDSGTTTCPTNKPAGFPSTCHLMAKLSLPNCVSAGGVVQFSTSTHLLTCHTLVASDLPNTAVVAGTYTCPTLIIDAQGRITSASNGSCSGGGLSWAILTNGQWTSLTNTQWTTMTN